MSRKSQDPIIEITKRPAMLGASINTRCEKHGDEDVPACDIPLSGIMLSPEESNALVPYFTRAFFDDQKGHKVPSFPQLDAVRFREKFEEATVTISVGVNGSGKQLELEECTLAKLKLEPMSGGLTALSLVVQAEMPDHIEELLQRLGGEVTIEIADAKVAEKKSSKQGELPINTFGEGEQPEGKGKSGGKPASAPLN